MQVLTEFRLRKSTKKFNIIFSTHGKNDWLSKDLFELEIDDEEVATDVYRKILAGLRDTHFNISFRYDRKITDSIKIELISNNPVVEDVPADYRTSLQIYVWEDVDNKHKVLFEANVQGIMHRRDFNSSLQYMRADEWPVVKEVKNV